MCLQTNALTDSWSMLGLVSADKCLDRFMVYAGSCICRQMPPWQIHGLCWVLYLQTNAALADSWSMLGLVSANKCLDRFVVYAGSCICKQMPWQSHGLVQTSREEYQIMQCPLWYVCNIDSLAKDTTRLVLHLSTDLKLHSFSLMPGSHRSLDYINVK